MTTEAEAASDDEAVVEDLSPVRTFVTTVARAEWLTPRMRQVTLAGGDLVDFVPRAPDQFVYVLAPPPGRTRLRVDAGFTWEAYRSMPDDDRPVGAYYTVRRWRPDVHELDLVVVMHDDDPRGGFRPQPGGRAHGGGAAWGRSAAPGDPVALWGPRTTYAPPDGTDHHLLVGDETGMHAIAAILEALPANACADVLVEVADAEEHLPLPERAGTTVTWLHRDGAPAGSTSLLLDAARTSRPPTPTTYAWGGAESATATAIRRHLRDVHGMEHRAVSMTGYWRRVVSEGATPRGPSRSARSR